MRVKKASLIINPRTGQNVAKITDVLAIFSAAGWKTELALKEYGGHTMELAHETAQEECNLVIAYGGDGTLNQVVNGVMNTKGQRSIVGVIPGGTANVWAGEIGIPIDPVKAALSLVNSEARKVDIGHVAIDHISFLDEHVPGDGDDNAPVFSRQAIKVDSEKKVVRKKDKAKHHFLLMAGLGVDAAIMGGVSKPLKYRIGPLAVGISAMKELPTQHSFPIEIRTQSEGEPLWRGEAMQIVIGNTRRYADIAEMTPNAYIDDGILDLCVITAGDPLTTMQQLSSLVLRRRPDNLTAEYFHGPCLYITVPASVPMQLDGSVVKLKDYLNKAEYASLQQQGMADKDNRVMITYRFESMPRVLDVAIPCTYNDQLFEHDQDVSHAQHQGSEKAHVSTHIQDDDVQTDNQRHTEAQVSLAVTQQEHAEGKHQRKHRVHQKAQKIQETQQQQQVSVADIDGRTINILGKTPNPEKRDEYIIAGSTIKRATGELRPVAVVVNTDTHIYSHEGERAALETMRDMQEGMSILVEGKKSKRGVIVAKRVVL